VKIALIGTGKMGSMFEQAAQQSGMEIVERFTDVRPLQANARTRTGLKDVSVLVDFSVPDAVMNHIRAACELGINLVEGTTGWNHRIGEAESCVLKAGIGMIYASNFSLGVNLFYQVINEAARLFSPFSQYDVFIEEAHHKQKKDAPSGTALVLKNILNLHYRGAPVPVTSLRAGSIPGRHSVGFDSQTDTVRLEHSARNREGLAEGAVLATTWIKNKKGFFDFRDVADQMMKRSR
jgi:4-hydroxy-tetrahydrodipicolinate reductase